MVQISDGCKGRVSTSTTFPSHSSSSSHETHCTKTTSTVSIKSFMDSVTPDEQKVLDRMWAAAVYTNRFAFSCVNNPFLQDFFSRIRPGWKVPSAYKLSHGLLEDAHNSVMIQIRDTLEPALAIVVQVDGWSDTNRTSVVNIALYAGRPVFWKSVNPGTNEEDSDFITSIILDVIQKTEGIN